MDSLIGWRLASINMAGGILSICFEKPGFQHRRAVHISEGYRIFLNQQVVSDVRKEFTVIDQAEVDAFGRKMEAFLQGTNYVVTDLQLLPDNHLLLACSDGLRIVSDADGYEWGENLELWRLFTTDTMADPAFIATSSGVRVEQYTTEEINELRSDLEKWLREDPDSKIAKDLLAMF